ncbi:MULTISPECIES: glyoxylate/hydroxypyruvate reductase A [unclassified Variovorax]|uniref:2-hydroxyacid dehydrogenase n=1 Tax=unclassified Variovorax TaxID=663243 RepID=UPI002576FE25|nr:MULTISPECIES: glyoxylate/hydroxypyruvate reductase A [unclassified Variovorax]MDM0091516.1 glyoxylate/hydroxypyruvate reductase A [Variovorax sp. J22G40]MDM0148719.1 glyoxylate/hydroxypyruvate reductase A [Variovorax sp. J2P1-31]
MRVICAFAPHDPRAKVWRERLEALLPDFEVIDWQPDAPAGDYLVLWNPDQRIIDSQPDLRAIFNGGSGVDRIRALRIPAALPIVRLEDAGMSEQMADYVTHELLHYFREFDHCEDLQNARKWLPFPPREKSDFPVGILGFGTLGSVVAERVRMLGFPVHAWARSARGGNVQVFVGAEGLREFAAATRVLICLVPLTEETQHILNARLFSQMPRNSYVINIARGGHLDEEALIPALDCGQLAGATVDVLNTEPASADHPFWTHPRVRITPHVSATPIDSIATQQIASKIKAHATGAPITGIIDPKLGY